MPCAVGEGRLTAEPERSGGWPEVSHFIFVSSNFGFDVVEGVCLCVCAFAQCPEWAQHPPPPGPVHRPNRIRGGRARGPRAACACVRRRTAATVPAAGRS